TYFHLGLSQLATDRDAGIERIERAIAMQPTFSDARFASCIAELAPLYDDEAEIDRRRAAYSAKLDALVADAERLSKPQVLAFFLAYQGRNDRDLQHRLGSLICRLMSPLNPPTARIAEPAAHAEPVRVGIVTGQFHLHSLWQIITKGWLSQLDRQRFPLFCYHTASKQDAETDLARSLSERFVQGPFASLEAWRDAIIADRPHAIIYPEIGIDATAARLASLRLAPVQCVSWGHPSTTGYPTIDYFLTSEAMEPPDGAEHYTERLGRLPHPPTFHQP